MGHIRLGRLPKSRRWREVVALLEIAPHDVPAVTSATLLAAEKQLLELPRDTSLIASFWLLTRVAAASRDDDFGNRLNSIGFTVAEDTSLLDFLSQLSDRVRRESHAGSGHFAELASLSMRQALAETVEQHGPGLFGSSLDHLQAAFRAHSGKLQFGSLSRRFFGDFFARVLAAGLDRAVSLHVSAEGRISTISDSADFSREVQLYARQSGRIVEDFAAGWYSKHNWESRGEITYEEAQGFVAVALRKLRAELKMAASF